MDLVKVAQNVRNLYDAARLAHLNAKEHEIVLNSAKELDQFLKTLAEKDKPKEVSKKAPKVGQ